MKKLSEMTDEGLALSYINGDNRAFDLLLSRNQSKLFSYRLVSLIHFIVYACANIITFIFSDKFLTKKVDEKH